MFYAIKRKRDGLFVTGTDYRAFPHKQICNPMLPPVIISDYGGQIPDSVRIELLGRGINEKNYAVVPVGMQAELSCDGCKWRGTRYQKCSCCVRCKGLKDAYEG